jgi:hypothetical protein
MSGLGIEDPNRQFYVFSSTDDAMCASDSDAEEDLDELDELIKARVTLTRSINAEHFMEASLLERISGTTSARVCAIMISCIADHDGWMRLAKRSDGSDYYGYILLYTDDALVVSDNAEQVLRNVLGRYFTLKEESIGPPKSESKARQRSRMLGFQFLSVRSSGSQECGKSILTKRDDVNWKLPTRAETPIQTSYRPELDVSPELQPIDAAYYISLIDVLRWIVELGRVDVCLKCSMLSSHLALPREGHMYQYRIELIDCLSNLAGMLTRILTCFAYLKK